MSDFKSAERRVPPLLGGPEQSSALLQDTGFAKVLLTEFAFETVMLLRRPATLGETLRLVCTRADVNAAELNFEEVDAPAEFRPTADAEDAIEEEGSGEEEDGADLADERADEQAPVAS